MSTTAPLAISLPSIFLSHAVTEAATFEDADKIYENKESTAKLAVLALVFIGSCAMAALSAPLGMAAWTVVAIIAASFPFIDRIFAKQVLEQRALTEYIDNKVPAFGAGKYIVGNMEVLEQLIAEQKDTNRDLTARTAIEKGTDGSGNPIQVLRSLYYYINCSDNGSLAVLEKLLQDGVLNTQESQDLHKKHWVRFFIHICGGAHVDHVRLMLSSSLKPEDCSSHEQWQIWFFLSRESEASERPDREDDADEVARLLLAAGFNINSSSKSGKSVLVVEQACKARAEAELEATQDADKRKDLEKTIEQRNTVIERLVRWSNYTPAS